GAARARPRAPPRGDAAGARAAHGRRPAARGGALRDVGRREPARGLRALPRGGDPLVRADRRRGLARARVALGDAGPRRAAARRRRPRAGGRALADGHRRRARRAQQALRRVPGRRPRLPDRRRRRDLRLPRSERRRQVHDDPDALRPAGAQRRPRECPRRRRRARPRGRQAPHRLHEPALQPLRRPERAPEHPLLRRRLRAARSRGARARGLGDRHGRARGQAGSADGRAAGRLEAAARPRVRGAAPAEGGVPRRADERRRPDLAPPLLAPDRRDVAERHHRLRHDPLSGRGRVLPPARADPRRPPGGARHGLGAEERLRRPRGARGGGGRKRGRRARADRLRAVGARDLRLRHAHPRRGRGRRGGPAPDHGDAQPGRRAADLDRADPAVARGRLHPPRRAGRGGAPGGEGVIRLRAVMVKELRQIRRDPFSLGMLIVLPAFMLVLYGFALNFDVRHVRLAVQDRDQSARSRELVAAFTNSTYFDLRAIAPPGTDLLSLTERRVARAVLVIPEGYARTLAEGRGAPVQFLLDGADSTTASTVLGYARSLVGEVNLALVSDAAAGAGSASVMPLRLEPRVLFNPELESTQFLVPGLIGFLLMVTAVLSTALSVVREKERGTMEQLRMAPLRTAELIVGKTLPYLAISLVATVMILVAARILFGVEIRGSHLHLL